jgi:hypothetical protein
MRMEPDDPLNGDHQSAADVYRAGTLRQELREMPALQRRIIYVSLFLMFMLFIQSIFIMPVILGKYGWGYSVN